MASRSVKLPLIKDPRIEDLLLWRDVKKSGIAFAGLTAIYAFFTFGSTTNVISLSATCLSIAVFTMLLWRVLGGVLKRPPPPLPRIITEGVAEAELRSYADRLTPSVNHALSFVNRILSGRDPTLSVIIGIVLWVVSRVAAMMSLLSLAYLPVLLAFTIPKVYELRKDEIDAGLNAGRAKVTEIHDKYLANVLAMIPKAAPVPAESSSTTRKID